MKRSFVNRHMQTLQLSWKYFLEGKYAVLRFIEKKHYIINLIQSILLDHAEIVRMFIFFGVCAFAYNSTILPVESCINFVSLKMHPSHQGSWAILFSVHF